MKKFIPGKNDLFTSILNLQLTLVSEISFLRVNNIQHYYQTTIFSLFFSFLILMRSLEYSVPIFSLLVKLNEQFRSVYSVHLFHIPKSNVIQLQLTNTPHYPLIYDPPN